MIHYSPMSRYSAQRIADKVGNGAYFYSNFTLEIPADDFYASAVQKLINKLTQRYHLDLSVRQRTYRLNKKKEPIADLVVQKRVGQDIFDFWLLVTTPNSQAYNTEKVEANFKQATPNQKVLEVEPEPLVWNKQTEQQEVEFIQAYFKDHEAFKLALYQPIKLDFGERKEVELVRLSHSTRSKKYAKATKSAKNYSWTWRYTKTSEELLKQYYRSIMNDLISNPNKEVGRSKLREFYKDLQSYSVFKGNRYQVGKLFTEMAKYHWKKTGSNFRQAPYYVDLQLRYLERQKIYADDAKQFVMLRRLYEKTGKEFDKNIIMDESYHFFRKEYF